MDQFWLPADVVRCSMKISEMPISHWQHLYNFTDVFIGQNLFMEKVV